MNRLPSIRSLEAFVSIARLGSFAAAGEELHVSVPALSRRLSALEFDLGFALFERRPRGVVLTAEGVAYHAKILPALKMLRVAHTGVATARNDTVRLTTIAAFANRWLLPRLPRFSSLYPDIEVDIATSTAFEALEEQDFDIAIRLARDDRMSEPPLIPITLSPVWQPGSLPEQSTPEDVAARILLDPDHRPEFWEEWLAAHGIDIGKVEMRLIDPLILYELAANGLGVAIGLDCLIVSLVARERLVAMDRFRIRSERSFHLLQAPKANPAARVFAQWLHLEAEAMA